MMFPEKDILEQRAVSFSFSEKAEKFNSSWDRQESQVSTTVPDASDGYQRLISSESAEDTEEELSVEAQKLLFQDEYDEEEAMLWQELSLSSGVKSFKDSAIFSLLFHAGVLVVCAASVIKRV
mmetsp:Transcript_46756/g.84424  ORF Transcript_46756/g.84424 Transcript_46756/m.84424 type:complete len:123 (+) Transcript_46756:69-437(+)|eukprot:CAMPEP_0197622542 /NCGR_PEP_ID=MMETSP1338-20131121/2807_1 /TAXON_ID=43686 ORGANISM="Pelagodinium beii, Strain RCC1491" /NCGR_SAMPLE_ID=MMETSP1338 /ASSEMBLY_ACC=CAM_ASM_000754 /LENGTH=122 /DNA_ID=CAMNT_0043192283 /DNA_START=64 /DNA_END=432 /DNA_ORIENTATION=-